VRGVKKKKLRFPRFDVGSYLREEIRDAKAALGAVALGTLIGVVSALFLAVFRDALLSVFIGVLSAFFIKFVYDVLKTDITLVPKSKLAGTVGGYFITWLAVWVLLINPPIMDLSPPTLSSSTPGRQELGSDVYVLVEARDNYKIDSVELHISTPNGSEVQVSMDYLGRAYYVHYLKDPVAGKYDYTVTARDVSGYSETLMSTFEVFNTSAPTISLYGIENGSYIKSGDKIGVSVSDNVQVVLAWYVVDPPDGPWYTWGNVTEHKLKLDDAGIGWISTSKLSAGRHRISVCAVDSVPYTRHCEDFYFSI